MVAREHEIVFDERGTPVAESPLRSLSKQAAGGEQRDGNPPPPLADCTPTPLPQPLVFACDEGS